jgi:hypothetical protein
VEEERTSPEAPCTISPASMGPLSEDPSPLRGMLMDRYVGNVKYEVVRWLSWSE